VADFYPASIIESCRQCYSFPHVELASSTQVITKVIVCTVIELPLGYGKFMFL